MITLIYTFCGFGYIHPGSLVPEIDKAYVTVNVWPCLACNLIDTTFVTDSASQYFSRTKTVS